jgi:hypothetical protein
MAATKLIRRRRRHHHHRPAAGSVVKGAFTTFVLS